MFHSYDEVINTLTVENMVETAKTYLDTQRFIKIILEPQDEG